MIHGAGDIGTVQQKATDGADEAVEIAHIFWDYITISSVVPNADDYMKVEFVLRAAVARRRTSRNVTGERHSAVTVTTLLKGLRDTSMFNQPADAGPENTIELSHTSELSPQPFMPTPERTIGKIVSRPG